MNRVRVKTDLRCNTCVEAIRPILDADEAVTRWSADVAHPDKVLTVEGERVTLALVDTLLRRAGYQAVGELPSLGGALPVLQPMANTAPPSAPPTSYYPLLLILCYLLGTVALGEYALGGFEPMRAMRHFMAGFFLVFSFFKMLDVAAFAAAYRGYDIIAQRWPPYGYLYPFIELGLGAAYLANVQPTLVNLFTLVVMGVSTIGVVQSLIARKKIRCACLGAVFNLPMSAVTLTEDLLMVAMAAIMLAWPMG